MGGLTTYQDQGIKEDLSPKKGQKPKSFDKKSYWTMKRVKKPKKKHKK